jgi:hypothetical protein
MSMTAMKQALEALDRNWDGCVNSPEGEAITALNAAIEAAKKQEPVARLMRSSGNDVYPKKGYTVARTYEELPENQYPDTWEEGEKLYTTPPAAQQEHDAYGYAKRLAVAIWEQHYKDVAPQWRPFDDLLGVLTQIDNMTAGLTAQRQPQYNKTEMNCFVQNLYDQKMREGKRGHYETMFHVVHRAIEAAHGIKENT